MAPGTRELRKGELLAILGEIFREKDTGTLVLQQAEISRFLYLQEGTLIFAASNAPEDKFTQILIDQGKLTYEQLEMATEKKGTRTIGRTLVEMGFLSSDDLLGALVEQLKRIAFSAQNWSSGTAAFKPGVLPQNVARLPISTPRFLTDLALALDDREALAQALGNLDAPLSVGPQEREAARAMGLSPEEARLLEQVDGQRNARQLCERAGLDLFTGGRFLLGLARLGFLQVKASAAPPPTQPLPAPVDLSFLDEPLPPPKPAEPERPAPPPPPVLPVQDLPFGEPTQERAEAKGVGLLEEKPAPRPAPAKRSLTRDSKSVTLPELLPMPGQGEGTETPEQEPPSFLLEKPSKRRPVGRLLAIVAVVAVLAGAGAFAGWYFFLRESEVVPVPLPKPARPSAARKAVPPAAEQVPAQLPQAAQAPAPAESGSAPAATPPPVVAQAAPAVSGAPEAKVPGAVQPTNAASVPLPTPSTAPKPSPAKSAPAPAAGAPQDLLAQGKYPEAARAFREAFRDRKAGYVVNIEVACQAETVAKGLAAAGGGKEYAILPYDLKGRACYLVVWGDYPDRPAAEAALKAMPAFFLQNAQPRVVPWSKIRELASAAP